MAKLIKWFKWVDDNLLHISLSLFILAVSLIPKIPIKFVEYTYIRIRIDDIFPVVVGLVFLIQLLRRKIKLNTKFLPLVIAFWVAVFISFAYGHFVQGTIPIFNIGLLHSLRRIQYMAIFFIAASAISSEKRFFSYMNLYFVVVVLVGLYGLGQRFIGFPSIQSMNPAYADGRLLLLNEYDRINSTFGGHFDLAAYLTFSMSLLLGFFLFNHVKKLFGAFILSLIILIYTAARSSFIAYFISMSSFLIPQKKFKLYFLIILITAVSLLATDNLTKRFKQTFQIKTVFINEQTGLENIDQKITVKELPAGSLRIPLKKGGRGGSPVATTAAEYSKIRELALEQAMEEAKSRGTHANTKEVERRAAEIAKYIKPQRSFLCDISCATRLQIEWPRAIGAFLYNPLIGTGPSSITAATDNDYLRWLGEFGLLGTTLFIVILISIVRYIVRYFMNDPKKKYIGLGYLFGFMALAINALYVDVFEASKVAYNFWLVSGLFVGYVKIHEKK
jgi:hypothetical protein